MKLTTYEKENYIFDEERDYEILQKAKDLENKELTAEDRQLVELVKEQLKDDWRATLLIKLNRLSEKYG